MNSAPQIHCWNATQTKDRSKRIFEHRYSYRWKCLSFYLTNLGRVVYTLQILSIWHLHFVGVQNHVSLLLYIPWHPHIWDLDGPHPVSFPKPLKTGCPHRHLGQKLSESFCFTVITSVVSKEMDCAVEWLPNTVFRNLCTSQGHLGERGSYANCQRHK